MTLDEIERIVRGGHFFIDGSVSGNSGMRDALLALVAIARAAQDLPQAKGHHDDCACVQDDGVHHGDPPSVNDCDCGHGPLRTALDAVTA